MRVTSLIGLIRYIFNLNSSGHQNGMETRKTISSYNYVRCKIQSTSKPNLMKFKPWISYAIVKDPYDWNWIESLSMRSAYVCTNVCRSDLDLKTSAAVLIYDKLALCYPHEDSHWTEFQIAHCLFSFGFLLVKLRFTIQSQIQLQISEWK